MQEFSQQLCTTQPNVTTTNGDFTFQRVAAGCKSTTPWEKNTVRGWITTSHSKTSALTYTCRKSPSRCFVCVSCDRAFTRNGDLRRHEFTKHHDQNSSEGKFRLGNKHMRAVVRDCPHPSCQTSSRLDNLPKHVQRRHTEVWEAVTVRNPHALWYDKCVDFYRSRPNSNYRLEGL